MTIRRTAILMLATTALALPLTACVATSGTGTPGTPAPKPSINQAAIDRCRADKQAAVSALSKRVDPENKMPIDQWNKLIAAMPEPDSCKALTDAERAVMAG